MRQGQNIWTIESIRERIKNWEEYKRKVPTYWRLPKKSDLWKKLKTYVKKNWKIVEESTVIVKRNDIIVRNPFPIGQDENWEIYNDWCIPRKSWIKKYWRLPSSSEFEPFTRNWKIKAIEVNEEVIQILWWDTEKQTATLEHFNSREWFNLWIWDKIALNSLWHIYPIDLEQFQKTYEKDSERRRFIPQKKIKFKK